MELRVRSMIDPVSHPTVKIEKLEVQYRVRGTGRKVLDNINLEIRKGECYGLVGESGCGKSTVGYDCVMLPEIGRYPARSKYRKGARSARGVRVPTLEAGQARSGGGYGDGDEAQVMRQSL